MKPLKAMTNKEFVAFAKQALREKSVQVILLIKLEVFDRVLAVL